MRRGGQRSITVEHVKLRSGCAAKNIALVERLELPLGLAQPLEPAEVVVGQPRLDLARLVACRRLQRGTRRHRPHSRRRAASRPSRVPRRRTAGTGPVGIVVEADRRIDRRGVELRLVLEHVDERRARPRLFGDDRDAGEARGKDQPAPRARHDAAERLVGKLLRQPCRCRRQHADELAGTGRRAWPAATVAWACICDR